MDGIRVQKVVDGTNITNYLVDENRLYAQVLEERDGEGNLTVSYVYGDDLISQKRGDSFSYYHYDGIGSTRALTDIHGNITDTYTYDSFGMLTSRTGTTENDYLFTGEQYDANVNFYYLRARYMNPALGRFLTMDSWGGIITDPITLHKYLYADCDPVNKIDPSGHFSILGVMTAITITATIASIAIPVFTGIYLAIVNKVSVLDYIAALCSEDVWIEAAIGIGMGAVLGLGIKAIAKKLACEVVAFIGVIMSLWSLYQSINLSIDMINGGVSREQVARYLAVLTATVILTTIIGKVCFTEDTLIKTDDGYKEIKDIEVGDLVYSEDPLTGEKGLKKVTNVFVNETSVIVRVFVEDEEIETTPTHPFWVIGKGWVAAGDIEAGDKVYLYSGEGKEVKEVRFEYLDTPIKVYNFEVEDWHTYFVSEQDVFVHNSCDVSDETLEWLNKGDPENTVYYGMQNEKGVYTGITKQDLNKRLYQHNYNGKNFDSLSEQYVGLTRNQARAIEQYFIENGTANALNKANSISPKSKYYSEALKWAKNFIGN